MAILTASHISTSSVTPEQIGRAHKCFSGSTAFYMVESESDSTVEYKVTWDAEHGFRCTCKAGQNGFANCKAGCCKHVKWAVAAAREEREAVAELTRAIAEQAATKPAEKVVTSVDAATLARVQAACEAPRKVSRAKAPEPRAFSLLR